MIKSKRVAMENLKSGDVVSCHGCQWELTTKITQGTGDDLAIAWKTALIFHDPIAMPKSWAESWTIQSAPWVLWSVVEK